MLPPGAYEHIRKRNLNVWNSWKEEIPMNRTEVVLTTPRYYYRMLVKINSEARTIQYFDPRARGQRQRRAKILDVSKATWHEF